ncbi:MAG: helix-turn-helix domain-containing protein [Solirubrobacteraceae bacterium]
MRVRSIRDLASAARGRRLDLRLNQAELAERAGVSRKWLVEFEAGKPSAELGLAMCVLDELGLALDVTSEGDGSSSGGLVDLDTVLEEHRGT